MISDELRNARIESTKVFITVPQCELAPGVLGPRLVACFGEALVDFILVVAESADDASPHNHLHALVQFTKKVKKSFARITVAIGQHGDYRAVKAFPASIRYLLKEQDRDYGGHVGRSLPFFCRKLSGASLENCDPYVFLDTLLALDPNPSRRKKDKKVDLALKILESKGKISKKELIELNPSAVMRDLPKLTAFTNLVLANYNDRKVSIEEWKPFTKDDGEPLGDGPFVSDSDKVRALLNYVVPRLAAGVAFKRGANAIWIHGPPGVRKTSLVHYIAKTLNVAHMNPAQRVFALDGIQHCPIPHVLHFENIDEEVIPLATWEFLLDIKLGQSSNVKGGSYSWQRKPFVIVTSNKKWDDMYRRFRDDGSAIENVVRDAVDSRWFAHYTIDQEIGGFENPFGEDEGLPDNFKSNQRAVQR